MGLSQIATMDVVTVTPRTSLQNAAKLMREYHVGDVVVVHERDGRAVPIGILTDRDIVVSAVAFGITPDAIFVEDVIASDLVVAKVTDSFYHVLNIMKDNGIRRIPLVDSSGALEGIVSAEDIIRVLASELNDIVNISERQVSIERIYRRKLG
jgi:CBS domain-containing protein